MLAIQMMQQMIWQIAALLYSPVFWLAILLVYLQARQRARMKQDFFQLRREPVGKTVLLTTIAGLTGGVLASGLLLLLGGFCGPDWFRIFVDDCVAVDVVSAALSLFWLFGRRFGYVALHDWLARHG